jgi:protein-disulfide isomerase
MSKETGIMLGIAGLVLAGGIVLFITSGPANQAEPGQAVDPQSLVLDTSHMTGDKNAKVTLVEFGDFQCPACGFYHPKVKEILDHYKDDKNFNFVFRNYPLTQHQNAQIAAEAAEAAGSQGKYWEMHNKLYDTQNDWSESTSPLDIFAGYAGELGLNVDQFKNDVTSHKFASIVVADQADGNKLKVNSTPTFYLNGQQLTQLPALNDFVSQVTDLEQK